MGTPANGYIEITCRNEESAFLVEELFGEELNKTLLEYYGEGGYFNFYSFQRDGNVIFLENDSGRIQNCEWQLDILFKFLREKARDLVETFMADISTSENYIHEEFEDLDLEEDEL